MTVLPVHYQVSQLAVFHAAMGRHHMVTCQIKRLAHHHYDALDAELSINLQKGLWRHQQYIDQQEGRILLRLSWFCP